MLSPKFLQQSFVWGDHAVSGCRRRMVVELTTFSCPRHFDVPPARIVPHASCSHYCNIEAHDLVPGSGAEERARQKQELPERCFILESGSP